MDEVLRQLQSKFKSILMSTYRMEEEIAKLPAGSLVRSMQHGKDYYYWKRPVDGKMSRTYVKRKDLERLKAQYQEKVCLEASIQQYRGWLMKAGQTLLSNGIVPEELEEECRQQYKQRGGYITQRGERVASVSERRLADTFFSCGLDYRYKAPLILGERIYWPVYTIQKDQRCCYWEHYIFSEDLKKKPVIEEKYLDYMKEGILQGVNLIITCDREGPISEKSIRRILQAYELIE